eukprot:g73161.t1
MEEASLGMGTAVSGAVDAAGNGVCDKDAVGALPASWPPGAGFQVPSAVDALQQLHDKHPWLPGKEHVRPLPAIKLWKQQFASSLRQQYASETDYVLATIFGFAPELKSVRVQTGLDQTDKSRMAKAQEVTQTLYMVPRERLAERKTYRLVRNSFPYQMPEGTRHYIMWYTWIPTAKEITQDIGEALYVRLKHKHFQFCWYQNPKMTVREIFHVQVFWRVLPMETTNPQNTDNILWLCNCIRDLVKCLRSNMQDQLSDHGIVYFRISFINFVMFGVFILPRNSDVQFTKSLAFSFQLCISISVLIITAEKAKHFEDEYYQTVMIL